MWTQESSGDVHPYLDESPRVSMPFISHRSPIRDSINEWLEDLLRSSRNMEILAERSLGVIGDGDRDLRMREMTPEDRASLEKYAVITKDIMHTKKCLDVSHHFYLLPCIFRFLKTFFFLWFFHFCY